MRAEPKVRDAREGDAEAVWGILDEAARWQIEKGTPLWLAGEMDAAQVARDVRGGLVLLAEVAGEAAGTIRVQGEDPLFWPDLPEPRAAYVHRLAVRRRFAGGAVSTALLRAAVGRARAMGRRLVRLDCPASRARLRAVYEGFGFSYHSDRQVGPYLVSRYEYDSAPESR